MHSVDHLYPTCISEYDVHIRFRKVKIVFAEKWIFVHNAVDYLVDKPC